MKTIKKRSLLALSLAATTSWAVLSAQSNDPAFDEEVYELSPFEVNTTEDVGYMATATTAGSRLNSELKDVAASVSVVTTEFLDDLGALDISEGLQMLAGAETWETTDETSANSRGYSGGDFGDRNSSVGTVRVRGLGRATNAVNFIETLDGSDRYNIARSAFLRGPNSILFGLSKPAGLVNSTTKKASLYKDLYGLDLTFDNFGTNQVVLDASKVLIENKLAVRAVYKNAETKHMFKNTFRKDDRIFLTATWKPFESTTITGYFEDVNDNGRLPNYRLVQDNVSGWLDLWNKAHDSGMSAEDIAANFYWDASAVQYSESGKPLRGVAPRSSGVSVADIFTGNSINPTLRRKLDGRDRALIMYYSGDDWSNADGGQITYAGTTNPNGGQPTTTFRKFFHRSADPYENTKGFADPKADNQGIWPWKDYDIGAFPGTFRSKDNQKYHVNIDQKIAENFYVSATFQHENDQYDQMFTPISQQQQISLDINTHLVDGTENPNFLRPFMYGRTFAQFNNTEFDNALVQANYDLRFEEISDKMGWLGFHRITGFYSNSQKDSHSYRWGYAVLDNIDGVMTGTRENAIRQLYQMWYVGDAVQPGDTSLNFTGFPNDTTTFTDGRTYSFKYYNQPDRKADGTWQMSPEGISDIQKNPVKKLLNRQTTDASGYGFSLQSFLWKDKIVTTLGWREDTVDMYNYGLNDDYDVQDPLDGTKRDDYTKPEVASVSLKEATSTMGVVFHINDSLRVFAQKSENFDLTTSRVDNFFRPIDPQSGKTEEYGVAASLMDNKLHLKLGFFETKQVLSSAGSGIARNYLKGFEGRLFTALENANRIDEWESIVGWDGNAPIIEKGAELLAVLDSAGNPTFDDDGAQIFDADDDAKYVPATNVASVQDSQSKGWSLEATYNPTPSWRMHFNVSKIENIGTNKISTLKDYFDFRAPYWGKYFAEGLKADGTNNATPPEMQSGDNVDSLADLFEEILLGRIVTEIQSEGTSNHGLSEYSAKFATAYTMREGALKGLMFGANLSWESGKALGYILKEEKTSIGGLDDLTVRVADLDNTLEGDSTFLGGVMVGYKRKIWDGKVDWKVQLNVRNLINSEGDLRVIRYNPNESPIYGISNPTTYRLSMSFRY